MSKPSACKLPSFMTTQSRRWLGLVSRFRMMVMKVSFLKRTVPTPLQLSDNFLEQRVYYLLELQSFFERTVLDPLQLSDNFLEKRVYYLFLMLSIPKGQQDCPKVLLSFFSFSKRTIHYSISIEKKIPGAEGLLPLLDAVHPKRKTGLP